MLGWGLMRTMTLAEGAPKCNFRFKRGGNTNVAMLTYEGYRKHIEAYLLNKQKDTTIWLMGLTFGWNMMSLLSCVEPTG